METTTSKMTVRQRVDAICAAEKVRRGWGGDKKYSIYQLAKVLGVGQQTLKTNVPASALLDWVLLRCEEEGVGYYERITAKRSGT